MLISSYLNNKGTSGQEEVQKELKFVLTMLREKKANSSLSSDMREIWVNQYSTSREIQTWLTVKGFSEKCIDFIFYLDFCRFNEFDYSTIYPTCRICKQLEDMNGMELFNLSRRRLEQLCGLSEGSRLNGQLTLAKNECGVSASWVRLVRLLFLRSKFFIFSLKRLDHRNSSKS